MKVQSTRVERRIISEILWYKVTLSLEMSETELCLDRTKDPGRFKHKPSGRLFTYLLLHIDLKIQNRFDMEYTLNSGKSCAMYFQHIANWNEKSTCVSIRDIEFLLALSTNESTISVAFFIRNGERKQLWYAISQTPGLKVESNM